MKFILYRDPRNKIQKIPCAVMQTAGLDRAEKEEAASKLGGMTMQ